MEVKLGICVPGGEEEKEVENVLFMFLWEETFNCWNDTLWMSVLQEYNIWRRSVKMDFYTPSLNLCIRSTMSKGKMLKLNMARDDLKALCESQSIKNRCRSRMMMKSDSLVWEPMTLMRVCRWQPLNWLCNPFYRLSPKQFQPSSGISRCFPVISPSVVHWP